MTPLFDRWWGVPGQSHRRPGRHAFGRGVPSRAWRSAVFVLLALALVLGESGAAAAALPGRDETLARSLSLQTTTAEPTSGHIPIGIQVFDVTQEDLDQDGQLDLTIIECAIVTPDDRVLVFDGGRNMVSSKNWEEATDFADDTWVFDIGGTGELQRATMIVAFSTVGDDRVARVYDGTVTGGVVHYALGGTTVRVIAPEYPSLIVRSLGDWLLDDGTLNYNLIWQFDGPAADRQYAERYPDAFVLDGNLDAEGEVRDANHDGIPEFLWTSLRAGIPETERLSRAGILVNSGSYQPAPITRVIFWPLLNIPDDPQGKNYFDTPLFLGFNWRTGLIESFGFDGYPIEHGYHINTLNPLLRGVVNILPFENPMAYYDLAHDRDGRPELFIRMAYTPPGDPFFATGGPTRTPIEMVQYSWNQWNHEALLWDYKVDLAGRNPIGHVESLGGLLIEQVPHDELPRWVTTNPWAFATFVAYESGDGYLSSEGLYDWSTLEGVQRYEGIYAGSTVSGVSEYTSSDINSIPQSEKIQRDYLAGASPISPEGLYQSILAGFRGEYAEINGRVELYFSPIDARLHLVGASRGTYNLGNRRRIEYRNLDQDPYIDSWELFDGTRLTARLYHADEYLIHGENDRVVLLQASVPRELFRTQPPTNYREWMDLGGQLEAQRRNLVATDFAGILDQFDGARVEIENASLRDFRLLENGEFRFVLDLRPGFRASNANLLKLTGLQVGSYAVVYDGAFRIEPLTPPALSAVVGDPSVQQLERTLLPVTLRNDGLQDVQQATFELWAAPPGAASKLIAEQTVTLPAEDATTVIIDWAPLEAGAWTFTPQVILPDGRRVTFPQTEIAVLPTDPVDPVGLLAASSTPRTRAIGLAGLIAFAAIGALTVWRHSQPSSVERNDDAQ